MSAPVCPVSIRYVSAAAREIYARDGGLRCATPGAAGMDLRACCAEETISIPAGGRALIPAGVAVQPGMPGIAGFVYSRSGLGAKRGVTVAQGVGLIDPDYTGEIMVMLLNTADQCREIRRGERMAQLVFQPFFRADCTEVPALNSTERGSGGFGHTGRQ